MTGATGLGGQGFFVISSIKPTATTAKPASTLSAWYLGGPDEGGIASKTITLPQLTAEQTFAKPTPQTMEEKGVAIMDKLYASISSRPVSPRALRESSHDNLSSGF